MIVVDYNQTAIGSFMAEAKGSGSVDQKLQILRTLRNQYLLFLKIFLSSMTFSTWFFFCFGYFMY